MSEQSTPQKLTQCVKETKGREKYLHPENLSILKHEIMCTPKTINPKEKNGSALLSDQLHYNEWYTN